MTLFFTKFHGFNRRCCNILLLIFCILPAVTFADRSANVKMELGHPPKTITGIINDPKGIPLPGVSVKVKGSNVGTVTDADGKFTINVPDGSNALVISFMGFTTQEISIEGRSSLNINLSDDVSKLDEVVIIGYGKQSRELLTTSISKLDTKVLENVPYANLASAMQGTLSGVRVQSTSGAPGAAPRVIIRGGTSINNPNGAAPLYIIDGVIRPNINDISPDDIESMQVLKDAASTAIYGARGSNGVVIITTKSGKSGSTQIAYNYDLTNSEVAKSWDIASAGDFIYYQRLGIAATARKLPAQLATLPLASAGGTGNDLTDLTAFTTQYLTPANQYKLSEGWQSMPDPLDPTKTIIYKGTDFQDVIFRHGLSQNHSLSVSGGTEKATFNAGLGYLTSNGIAITSFYKRLSLNLNGDLKVRDNLNVFGRIMFSNSGNNDVGNPFGQGGIIAAPTTKYKFEDGALAPGRLFGAGNPEYDLNSRVRKNSLDNLTMAIGARWDILPGLSFDPQISRYTTNTDARSFQKAYLNGPGNLVNSRSSSGSYSKRVQQQADAVFSYNKSFFNLHNIDAKAGFSYFGIENSSLSAQGEGASSDLIPTLNASAKPVSVSGAESQQVILGYFSRLNYDYDGKYLLSLNARYDGASNLGDKDKWGFFPGISVGWNLHREKFWKMFPEDLLNLKLRSSYGINGNIGGLGPYQAQGQYSVGTQYGGIAGIQNTILSNQDLQWEQSKTFDVGMDLGLFNRRVNILVDYYRRVTDHLLTSLSLPPSTGFGSILTNYGSLENKGFEVELNTRILPISSAVQWDLSFNASKVKNKILELPNNGADNNRVGGYYVWDSRRGDYAWLGGLQEGGTIGDLYAYKQIGIYSTDAEAASGPIDMIVTGNDKRKYGGDVNWLDADKNGIIDTRDLGYVGNIYPTWTGGFTSSFSYKNLNLVIRTDYTTGHTIYNETRARFLGQFSGQGALSTEVLRSWQKQGDITDIPRFYWADQLAQNNLRLGTGNSQFFEAGDFLALREVTLTYNLPKSLLEKSKISNLRFNLTGNNLHYFTRFKGLNPEDGGTDSGRYPLPRNIILGANITF